MTKVDISPDIKQCHCNNSLPAGSISTISGIVEIPSEMPFLYPKNGGFLTPKAQSGSLCSTLHDQSANGTEIKHEKPTLDISKLPPCSNGFMVGDCKNGHRYLKVMLCGKDWCPDCGKIGSWIHQRRCKRLLPKLKVLAADAGGYLGYLVVTVPEEYREWLLNKENLASLRRYLEEFLKRQYSPRCSLGWAEV